MIVEANFLSNKASFIEKKNDSWSFIYHGWDLELNKLKMYY